MTIDELIKRCKWVIERQDNINEYKYKELMSHEDYLIYSIALATLQAHKSGYKMFTYDYSERDWLPAECELTRLLEGLER